MATKKVSRATPKTKKLGASAAETKTGSEPPASVTIDETASAVTPVEAPIVAPAVPATAPIVTELPIASIRLDGGTQSRASLSTTTIAEYAEAMTAGAKFPPVVVFYDGKHRFLADGFHRVGAHTKLGHARIECEVRQGSQRDAILFSVTANATHGLRRTNADKRHAVELLLRDAKWSKKSDRWLAEMCGVSDPFVGKARREVLTVSTSSTREGRDGKQQPASKPKAKPTSATPAILAHEQVIAKHIAKMVAAGQALTRIRDGKQYKPHYETFEMYYLTRWDLDSESVQELMDFSIAGKPSDVDIFVHRVLLSSRAPRSAGLRARACSCPGGPQRARQALAIASPEGSTHAGR